MSKEIKTAQEIYNDAVADMTETLPIKDFLKFHRPLFNASHKNVLQLIVEADGIIESSVNSKAAFEKTVLQGIGGKMRFDAICELAARH